MTKDPENELTLDQIYDKYVDLYIHLDNLRWNVILAILVLFYSVFYVLDCLFEKTDYFQFSLGIGFYIVAGIVFFISHFIKKFVSGQDFICRLLANIEKDIFNNSEKALENEISFFERRRRSIDKKKLKEKSEQSFIKRLTKVMNTMKCDKKSEKSFIKRLKEAVDINSRSSAIVDGLLSKGAFILFIIGSVFIIADITGGELSKIQIFIGGISAFLILITFF